MRRFYRNASAGPCAGGFGVFLDDRPVPTPAKAALVLPSAALAEAIAAEWQAQQEKVDPARMPLMQVAATAIDRVASQRAEVIRDTAAYGGTDLLCYRADSPPELVIHQQQAWDPPLAWLLRRHGVALKVTEGVRAVAQEEAALRRLRQVVEALDDMRLTALGLLTASLGSLVLALAILDEEMDWQAAFAAATLDESFQAERWGEDMEAARRRENLRRDVEAYARFLALVGKS
ncbi:MAG: ATPase [Alphaproteobacteria bacterium]|nr:ATPase [Alphaproteobacteria bacterium]